MPLAIRVELNILRFEAPPADDAATERAVMAATAIAHEFDRIAATATAILAQVSDETIAAKRVEETIISMFSRGALERVEAGVVLAAILERETGKTSGLPSNFLVAPRRPDGIPPCGAIRDVRDGKDSFKTVASRQARRPLHLAP
jgi:hypothetical protein